MYDLIGETDRKGDRDPKHRAEEIIRICDVTGNKKLTKEEVSLSSVSISVLYVAFSLVHCWLQERSSHPSFARSQRVE